MHKAFDAGSICITWASGRGLGPGYLEFFGPQMALAFQLDAISQEPKNLAQPPPTCPRNGCCPHQKYYLMGRINRRCINSYYLPDFEISRSCRNAFGPRALKSRKVPKGNIFFHLNQLDCGVQRLHMPPLELYSYTVHTLL